MNAGQAFQWALRSVLGDKGPLVPAVVGIVAYCFFYPLPYLPEAVHDVPVVVADYDASPMSRQLERDLDATQAVRVAGVTDSVEEAIPRLQRMEIGGIVAVPKNFHRDVLRGTPTGVTVMGNGGYIVVDGAVLETTAEVLAETAAPALAAHLLQSNVPPAAVMRLARARRPCEAALIRHGPRYDSAVVPASTGLIVHQLMIVSICLVIGTWVEGGRWAIAPQGRLSRRLCGHARRVLASGVRGPDVLVWLRVLVPRPASRRQPARRHCVRRALCARCGGRRCRVRLLDGRARTRLQIIGGISIPLLFMSGFAFRWSPSVRPCGGFPRVSQHAGHPGIHQAQPDGCELVRVRPSFFSYCCSRWSMSAWLGGLPPGGHRDRGSRVPKHQELGRFGRRVL